MEPSLIDFLKQKGGYIPDVCAYATDVSLDAEHPVGMKRGFYLLLVTNGTASISDIYQNYTLQPGSLLIQTPSITTTLWARSADFCMSCVYIVPDYFDSLSDGQPMYSQLGGFLGSYTLPLIQLDASACAVLNQTMSLFSLQSPHFRLYLNGIVRHLCSVLLLQITEELCLHKERTSVCVRRTYEIFRHFKKLLVANYRQHHDIAFYADQLHISTTYLSRVVKHVTGRTVCFHMGEMICADARNLLECTDMDIKEIAHLLGFSNQSVFGKYFLKKTGLSPLKFRLRKDSI